MLGDIISPSIATWSSTQHFYTDLDVETPVVHGAAATDLHTPLLDNYDIYNKVYSNATSMLFDANETSAYQIVLNGTSGNLSNSNNILLNLGDGGGNTDGFITFNGSDGVRNASSNIVDVFIGERNEFDDQQLDDIMGYGDGFRARDPTVALVKMIAMSIVLGLLIFITIIGNVFVIAAIILERNLQNLGNYLVVSLAVADLLVACLVMPLGAVYEISEGWILGPELCDIWTSCDVLCCTASILHLVAIAADRYWTVTNIDYSNVRTRGRVFCMIFCVWFTALIISLAPLLGWKDPDYMQRIERQICMVSQDVGYQIFATCCTFYVPLLAILALYWNIYKIARRRIQRRIQQRPLPVAPSHNQSQVSAIGEISTVSQEVASTAQQQQAIAITLTTSAQHLAIAGAGQTTAGKEATSTNKLLSSIPNPYHKLAKRRQMLEAKRERKAAQTLAIITGVFAICWLPFFVMALMLSLCKECHISAALTSLFLWLGYFNSTLNPIIYTIFNPEFRRAFQRILCGRKRTLPSRSGKI
ncbi:5-hydroxytryptamine receptor 2B isoform X2 [Bactrocera dorsalis]|uniref:5-hydroxytryptamine receptor 2B isoform X2 n=1 Tax=Bactrocera dorsalis TaxID=27457 RepID=A0A8N4L7Q5_BACDO|nr:5-hydroxytryptamine receptor 2B isoform X2 [Bactrocera dorsalis]